MPSRHNVLSDLHPESPQLNTLQDIAREIEKAHRAVVTAHLRSDGDAIGSLLAMAHGMETSGIEVRRRNPGGLPSTYAFLPKADRIETVETPGQAMSPTDLLIVLDCPHPGRMGAMEGALKQADRVIAIDHHPDAEPFGHLNFADPEASSVGEILVDLFDELGWVVDRDAALCLLTSIYTDTGCFCHANTRAKSFEAAARLMTTGVDVTMMTDALYKSIHPNIMALKSDVLKTLRRVAGGRLAYISITEEMLSHYEVNSLDLQDFSDIPRSVRGVEVGITFQEIEGGTQTKASFRSKGNVNVNDIAALFGGGGHDRAAGAVVPHAMEKAIDLIVEGALDHLNGQWSEGGCE